MATTIHTTEAAENGLSRDQSGENPEEQKEIGNLIVQDQPMENGENHTTEPKKWRAKLYQLNGDGGWDDLGTGHCFIDSQSEMIKLVSESDETELLNSQISISTSYHRQRDTIITWMDDSTQMDLAISFQEIDGSQETWEIICNIQGKDPEEVSQDEDSDEEFLPEPDCSRLGSIHNMLQIIDISRKQKVIEDVLKDDEQYIRKLKAIFEKAEEEKNEECLKEIFLVFKDLVNISDIKLLEILVSDKYYLTLFGALEYNNEINNTYNETKHREFLKNTVKFKTFIAIDDPEVLQKIHENYRISYLKDTALATGLDENNLQTINNLMNSNNQTLIQSILLDQENITQIFESLKHDEFERRKEAISFISELFSISKNLQIQGRLNLLSSFRNIEGYNLLIFVLESIKLNTPKKEEGQIVITEGNQGLVSNALEILMSYLQSFPVTLNDLCEGSIQSESTLSQERFLSTLVEHMLETSAQEIKLQLHEFIRFLLDSGDSLIINKFYSVGLKIIADYFTQTSEDSQEDTNNSVSMSKSLGLDIIVKTISEDHYNCKTSIMSLDLIVEVAKLVEFNNKLLNIGVVKFYKALLATNFKPYERKMIQEDSLDCVVKIYSELKNKRNMIGSIIFDLFSKITRNDFCELASHLCSKFEIVKPFLQKCADKHDQKSVPLQEILTKLDHTEEGDKVGENCFKRSPKFDIGIKSEDFTGIDALKEKSVEEIKEDFNLSKPLISTDPGNGLEFTPNFDKDIQLETDEVLNDNMIGSLAEVEPANKSENGIHNENNEDSKKDLQLNIQQEDLTPKDKELAGKKREVKAAEKEQEEVQKQKESPIVQDQAQDGEAIEPSVDKDIADTGESNGKLADSSIDSLLCAVVFKIDKVSSQGLNNCTNPCIERKKQKVSEEEASCD